jgi:hypothetical protein
MLLNSTVGINKEKIMSDMYVKHKESKLSIKSKILLGAMALAVIVGLSTAAYAASGNTDNKNVSLSGQMIVFDPFALKSTRVFVTRSEGDPGLDMLLTKMLLDRPEIRIPYRPAVRSAFRPPLVLKK